jgi:hypothetical protein
MAGKFGSPSALFLVSGYNLLTNKLQELRHKVVIETEETTGLGDSWREHTPTGVSRAELAQAGAFFDTSTAGIHAMLAANTGTTRVVTLAFGGDTTGSPFVGFEAPFATEYEPLADNGKLTKANASYLVSGKADRGVILQPLAVKSADWNTKTLSTQVDYTTDTTQRVIPLTLNSIANPTVVTTPVPHGLANGDIVLISGVSTSSPTINGERVVTVLTSTTFTVPVNVTVGGTGGSFVKANSTGGGAGYLQITDCSGFTNFVGKIRDSADDTTYADLLTFTDSVADPLGERVTVAGTVDRYLSFDGNVTGTGSITAWCGFARW